MPAISEAERVLRSALITVARDSNKPVTLSYSELGDLARKNGIRCSYPMIDPPFRGLGESLGNISRYEHAYGRPLLSVMVVTQATGLPGDGFVPMAKALGRDVGPDRATFCRAELDSTIAFWRDPDPTRIVDAAFGQALDLLRKIQKDLKR